MKYCTNCNYVNEVYTERCLNCNSLLVGERTELIQCPSTSVINFPKDNNLLQMREMTRMAELTIQERDSRNEGKLLEDRRKDRNKLEEKKSKLEEHEESLEEEIDKLEISLPSLKKAKKKEKTELLDIYKRQLSEARKKITSLKEDLSKIDREIEVIGENISSRGNLLAQVRLSQQSQELAITREIKQLEIRKNDNQKQIELRKIELENNQKNIRIEEQKEQLAQQVEIEKNKYWYQRY